MAGVSKSYVDEWERAARLRQTGGEPLDLARVRGEAWNRFLSLGFPTPREEEWRFTSVAPIADGHFSLAPSTAVATNIDVASTRLPGAIAELVFVNGRFAQSLSRQGSLPGSSRVQSLAHPLAHDGRWVTSHVARVPAPFERHPFFALNTAFFEDGAFVEVSAGTVLEGPIHLLFVTTASANDRSWMAHPRIVVVLGENSQASVIETYAGTAGQRYFTNSVTELVVGENAVLDHYKRQYESAQACHVGVIHLQAARSATCSSHSISVGGALVRNDVVATLNGEGVECMLNGLYLADAHRLVDHHTTIDHARPHCDSREVYKGILAEHARGVFNGKIIVRPDAQKTDAKQTNRALLLSEDALVNTKPQLEIFANDVKCTHGAAVGQLDDESLFYLRSRGLSHSEARQILIHAFAADVLNRLRLESVRADVEARLQRQLARVLAAAA
jgi:Fe-S cluster assembly protein SufD